MNNELFTEHRSSEELQNGIEHILAAPKNSGPVELIVARPKKNQRQVLKSAELNRQVGLVGDNWKIRGDKQSADGSSNPEMQLNLMNSRAIQLIAGSKRDWPLAGDQFYVDMDLSKDNLPAGTRLRLGTAEIEVTAEPHLGCLKFSGRYGKAATLFVNSAIGKANCFRGICAKVIKDGRVNEGDRLEKL